MSRLRLFLFCGAASFAAWSAICALLHAVWPDRPVFSTLYRMITYHESHPYAFIAVVSVVFACVAAAAGPAVARLSGGRRIAALVGVVVVAVVLAGIPGGLLYMLLDIRAGFVPPSYTLRANLVRSATDGLVLGPFIAAFSVPFNILALGAGVGVLHVGLRIARYTTRDPEVDQAAGSS